MKRSSASLLLEFQSTSSKSNPPPGMQTSMAITPDPPDLISQQTPHSNPSLQTRSTVSSTSPTAINSKETTFSFVSPPQIIIASTNSSHPQKDSQSTAQFSFSHKTDSTITSDSPSNMNTNQSVQPSYMASLPKQTFNSAHTFHSTTTSIVHQQASTSFLSPHAQLTFNPAHQTQSCPSVSRGGYRISGKGVKALYAREARMCKFWTRPQSD